MEVHHKTICDPCVDLVKALDTYMLAVQPNMILSPALCQELWDKAQRALSATDCVWRIEAKS